MKNKISYETKIQDGRCRGLGRDYRPWFQIHEKDRPGIGMRFMWKKTGRMHEIIGRNRINFFYDLLWDDSVTNVMESYVDLTREKTAEFAVNHHLHPLFTGGGEFDVFVTDFLITYADGTQKAVDIIKPGTLNSPPMLNRHKVKEAYWKERGIPFEAIKISDPQQRQRRANMIQHLLQPLPDVPNAYEPVVLTAFLSDYNQTDMSIMEIARKVEKAFLLSFGDGVLPFWYLASHKRIILNPEEPIIFSRKRGEKQLMSTWPFSDNSGTFCHSDLLENSCFSMSDKTVWRIIHVSQSVIHMIEITDSIRLPVAVDTDTFKKDLQNGEYILTCSDPFHVPSRITDSMLRKQHLWEKSLSAFPVKTEMIWDKSVRKEAIEKLSLSLNVSSDTVLRQLSRYWQSGNRPESLAGKASNSGQTHESHMHKKAIGGQKATSDHHVNKVLQSQDYENMHTVIMEYYARPERSTIPDAFHELLNRYYTDADAPDGYSPDRPSLTQFSHYFYDTLSTEDKASIEMKRLGKKGAPLKGRAYFGNLSEAYYGYGDCCMLDATELDLELCYRYNTQERIGRAVLFYGIDVVTTQIPMVYLGIKSEGQYGARMLILCGLTDKVAFCRRYGVDIKEEDWPGSPYLPHCIYCDNSEMRGTFMDSFVTSLGVSVTNTLFNRGDLKSLVERHFHETLLRLGYIHGKVDKAYKDNTGRDYVKEAVLTIPDAWKIILSITVKYNQHRAVPFRGRPDWLEEKVTPTPNELAKWCMHNSTGRLRTLDPLLVNASMLPESSAEITPTGLIFHGLQYIPENEKDDAEFILARKHWKKRSRTHQPDKLTVHYDPNMISMIYRIIPGQKEPAVYHLSSVDELTFGNMSLVEVLLLLEIRNKQLADQREQDELHKAQIKKEIHETENQAKKRVKDHGRQYGKNGKITKHAQRVEQTLQYLDDLVMIQQEHLADHLLSLLENNPALSEQLDDTQPPNLADT